ncbi:hypothetical protein G7081_05660 [Vagococcus coleopterorum]|uniref:Uncharacterized protein n=1 Tax=Vagococcus coleopterorum TaxID=2714946 RepID=A0A6G8ANQ0_9ENTE|nr:hypothetical protein [Vagococcus coleopterorum]QIL46599.1 hypothetical protein G7081_05660 [Vagococcus coleopterorum]
MNKSSINKLLFAALLIGVGGSLLFNMYMTNKKADQSNQAKTEEVVKIKAGKTDHTYRAVVKSINKTEDGQLHSLFLTDVKGEEAAMFNDGVNIYTDELKVGGIKTDVKEIVEGDKVELITAEHAAVTMMLPPSIAGNGVVGINVL